jgi:hypothetical protein
MHTRYCVDCEQEFRPEIFRCSDCGGDLEDRYEEEDGEGISAARDGDAAPEVPAPPHDDQPVFDQPVFNTLSSSALKEAAECLANAAVRFRATGYRSGFQLFVRSEELSAARAALEGREGTITVNEGSEACVGFEGGVCPACGAEVPAGVLECPGCTLVVGAKAAKCVSCGSLLGLADVECPVCRAPEG